MTIYDNLRCLYKSVYCDGCGKELPVVVKGYEELEEVLCSDCFRKLTS